MEIPRGTMLEVWSHPDDMNFVAAGTTRRHLEARNNVVCITATRGESGETADEELWPTEHLREIRTGEQLASLDCIGEIEHHWLDYPDNGLTQVDGAVAVEQISEHIQRVQPAVILTWEPEGMTGSPDHRKVSEWTVTAAGLVAPNIPVLGAIQAEATYLAAGINLHNEINLYFNITQPPLATRDSAASYEELTPEEIDMKMKSLEAHASQTSRIFANDALRALLRKYVSVEAFIRLN